MTTNIVTFGKYRNQPVEAMFADVNYCDWLSAQDWFRTQHAALMAQLQRFNEPEETPEHNALQANFLDKGFIDRFALHFVFVNDGATTNSKVRFEEDGFDVILDYSFDAESVGWDRSFLIELKPVVGDDYPAIMRQMKSAAVRARRKGGWGTMVLITERLSSAVLDLKQMRAFFATAHITLLTLDEINSPVDICSQCSLLTSDTKDKITLTSLPDVV